MVDITGAGYFLTLVVQRRAPVAASRALTFPSSAMNSIPPATVGVPGQAPSWPKLIGTLQARLGLDRNFPSSGSEAKQALSATAREMPSTNRATPIRSGEATLARAKV